MHSSEQRRTNFGPQSRPRLEQRSARVAAEPLPVIVGYAAVFYDGTPRTQYQLWPGCVERIMPGAFSEAIDGDVAGLRNHNAEALLGRTTAPTPTLRLREDRVGLRYEIDPPDTTCGRETVTLIERGDMQGSSFAFRVNDERWTEEVVGGVTIQVREILNVTLYDVGPVTFPAYSATTAGIGSSGRQRHAGGLSRDAIRARLRVVEILEAERPPLVLPARASAPAPQRGPVSRDAIRARLRVLQLLEAA